MYLIWQYALQYLYTVVRCRKNINIYYFIIKICKTTIILIIALKKYTLNELL